MQKIKDIIRLILPPLFLVWYRSFAGTGQSTLHTFEGVYKDFSDIRDVTGYDDDDSLNRIFLETVSEFKDSQDKKLLPRSHIRSQIRNLLPMLASIAMNRRSKISILDFGGGMGYSFIDCLNSSIQYTGIKYYVVDLEETIESGRKIFPQSYNINFLKDISTLSKVDIVYLGSVLLYIPDYKALLLQLIDKTPEYIMMTEVWTSNAKTYATKQVNMQGRSMPLWIFELKEIVQILGEHNYEMIYKSVNYQPFHRFDNFPVDYRVDDSCNLLFSRKLND